ncbi:phage protein NinX family protein [Pseudomonas helmanticensis]|uniref:phage protein NinX family protein n=1 Tax=Pseudomonas helmanticensis TaxID=1471381 RepID=UPI0038142175
MNMTEVKTQDLSGTALDWAVALAVGWTAAKLVTIEDVSKTSFEVRSPSGLRLQPSTDWSQCGPLIAKIKIGFGPALGGWVAHPHRPNAPTEWLTADEPLVAICRAIVADRLGMVVSVPAELLL